MSQLSLVSQSGSYGQSYLALMFDALGPFYGFVLPLTGLALFVGACVVVGKARAPAVIASYLALLPLPALLGFLGTLQGLLGSYMVISASPVFPTGTNMAEVWMIALFSSVFGLLVMLPSYLVVAVGLFVRTVRSQKT